MLDMLDWLLGRQAWIEKSLARRYLEGATLLLYDVASSYLEGRCSPLTAFGHNRDGKQGKQQIVFGLLCVAVDVFAGNTADPSTVGVQVKKVQQRFGLESIALVGDLGLEDGRHPQAAAGGAAGRHIRHPDEPAELRPGGSRGGRGLQEPGARRAGVPLAQDGAAGGAPDLRL